MAKVLPFLPLFGEPEPPPTQPPPPDAEARRQALDIQRSFIVEAPAGSGKTGLLIQRFLKLLADDSVAEPEQVLAITFTNKATAELRDRVLAHLEAVRPNSTAAPATDTFDGQTRALAAAVLERDRQLGWGLLDHPHRLNIRTIDSVCAEIARTLPVLSGSGGRLAPTENAAPLHNEAARRTLLLLGSGNDPAFDDALRDLLLHRDNNLANCQALIAGMLRLRDQWGGLVPLTNAELDDAYLDANVLPRLERALDRVICATLAQLQQIFPAGLLGELSELTAELGSLDGYNGNPSPIAICADCPEPPEAISSHLKHWLALIHLLATPSGGVWRTGFNVNHIGCKLERLHKASLKSLIDQLSNRDDLLLAFEDVRSLPPAGYPTHQWAVAKSLFRVLGRALVELQFVFAERNQCDFTELTLLARRALGEESGAEDLAAALGARLQHLLVDEMQDTSTGQYELLELLTRSWDGYSQTVFLVGDPLQSIYLFRQARVERFIRALHTERLGDVPLTPLHLTANFRSQRDLVAQFNQDFSLIFPNDSSSTSDSVPYSAADAILPASTRSFGRAWHANPLSLTAPGNTPAQKRQRQAGRDAREVLRIARRWFAEPLPAGRRTLRDESGNAIPEPWKIAVLVRTRNHLSELISALKKFNADHPDADRILVRAVDIEPLNERQEVLDLSALTRALLHPADRVAVLAVLRAPWCGLSLADLHTLTGADDPTFRDLSIPRLIEARGHLLPDDSCQRMARVWNVLQAAAAQRARLTTAQRVERAWLSLGGDAWLAPTQLTNARRFFQLLDTLEAESASLRIDPAILAERLQNLYAEPDTVPAGSPCIELLTIHKAKGLEWDVVLVPALERSPGRNQPRLLNWSEIDSPGASPDDTAPIMLAPIAAKGDDPDPLYRWLNRIHREREAAERKRLFYVACTRARQELHLFAAPDISARGDINPRYDSLLESAWPAAEPHFAQPAVAAATAAPQPFELALAAAADPYFLQRLPLAFDPASRFAEGRAHKLAGDQAADSGASPQTPFARPEGSFAARSFGNAVHACLQVFADRVRDQGCSPASLLAELPAWTPRIAALLRAGGLPQATVTQLTREAHATLEKTLRDPDGLWLLAAHPGGDSELAVTALTAPREPGRTGPYAESVRIDRIFHAGPEPHSPGQDFLWIVDYKTASHGPTGLDDFLATQRATYGPQLETYAGILAPARAKSLEQVRLAVYFPTLPRLVWWNAAPPAPDSR